MREIKFRAINEITGELEYGNLLRSEITADGNYYINIARPFAFDPNVRQIACKKGTECQFTGQQDKNGVDIYEWDILQPEMYLKTDWLRGFVEFKNSAFHLTGKNYSQKTLCQILKIGSDANNEIMVIGNIYQNPELIQK